jgi:hypothetical protein
VINLADDSPTFQQKCDHFRRVTFVLCLLSIIDMFMIDESEAPFEKLCTDEINEVSSTSAEDC